MIPLFHRASWLVAGAFVAVAADAPVDAPAPSKDRVGFPDGYQKSFTVLRSFNRPGENKVVTVYGNKEAASVKTVSELPYPNGSVLVMETALATKDAAGKPVTEANGIFQKDQITGLHVMRREMGFGEAYQTNRTGAWEYVEYRGDGTFITPPIKSAACAACHVKAGEKMDFVYHGRFSPPAEK